MPMRRLAAYHRRAVRVVAADHVAVQHRDDTPQRHHGMQRVPVRAEQSSLLCPVPYEKSGARRRLFRPRSSNRQERDAHGGIVIRTIPDRITVDWIADAVVVLMAAE